MKNSISLIPNSLVLIFLPWCFLNFCNWANKEINSENVKHNLLKIKIPIQNDESEALWDAAADLVGISHNNDSSNGDLIPLPNADNYKDWFLYHENIDLRRHLQDIEIVLIEAALDKSAGQVSLASEKLKLRRTTLIEKMKKLAIEKPNLWTISINYIL